MYAMSAHHILIVSVCFQSPGAEQENIVGSSSDEIGFTTLERELEMNGHGNRTIHVLKVWSTQFISLHLQKCLCTKVKRRHKKGPT